jgi:hypothetical protein
LRVFIRPVALPQLSGPLQSIKEISYGEDQEIYVSKDVKEVKFYAFGAGGSSVDGLYAGSDGQFSSVSYKSLSDTILLARVGQGGGTGQPYGSHGGKNLSNQVIGGGCTFVTTSDFKPLVYAGGGGSGSARPSTNKHLKYSGPYTTGLNPGGSGYMWGSSGSAGHSGSDGTSYAPGGITSKNIRAQKYYSPGIGQGSNGPAGHGKLVIEFTY